MSKIRNYTLYTQMKQFTEASCKLLITLSNGMIPQNPRETLDVTDSGYSEKIIMVNIFIQLLWTYRDKLEGMSETTKVIDTILAISEFDKPRVTDNDGNLVKNPDYRPFVFVKLHTFLMKFLEKMRKLSFSITEFNRLYTDFESFIYTKKVRFKIFVPLSNFRSKVDRLEIGEGVEIRKISLEEIRHAYYQMFVSNLPLRLYKEDIPHCEFALVIEYTLDEGKFREESLNQIIEEPLWALIVFKKGSFGYGLGYCVPVSYPPSLYNPYFKLETPILNPTGSRYILEENESKDFITFFEKFRHRTQRVDIAVRRLIFSAHRRMLIDKLIDLMIGFEALYLPHDGELRFRLALNTSLFLETNTIKRKQTYKLIRKAYDLRGNVVHGDISKLPDEVKISSDWKLKKSEFINLVEEKLRESIQKFLVMSEHINSTQWLDYYFS